MSRVEEIQKHISNTESKLASLRSELEKAQIEEREANVSYPFELNQDCWLLNPTGFIEKSKWQNEDIQKEQFCQNNLFTSQENAENERDKRKLLLRFNQFRDKCNGDWTTDFYDGFEDKYYIQFDGDHARWEVESTTIWLGFQLFGYFKEWEYGNKALELFGDEIDRLYGHLIRQRKSLF